MPETFLYLYIPSFGLFGHILGLQNFGVFKFASFYKFLAPFILTGWSAVGGGLYQG
jgi:hypothetical protein